MYARTPLPNDETRNKIAVSGIYCPSRHHSKEVVMKNLLKLPRSVLGGVLLGSALALSAAPHAEGVDVQYEDVDLSSTQGASVLYERISRAAKRVCAPPTRRVFATCTCPRSVTRVPCRMQ